MSFRNDPFLESHQEALNTRVQNVSNTLERLTGTPLNQHSGEQLQNFANGYHYFGLHKIGRGNSFRWVVREWAPNAISMYLFGDFSGWRVRTQYAFTNIGGGVWELILPKGSLSHGQLYKLRIIHNSGIVDRLPSYAVRTVQDESTKVFCAQVHHPKLRYVFKHPTPVGTPVDTPVTATATVPVAATDQHPATATATVPVTVPTTTTPSQARQPLFIYEAHIGIAQEAEDVGTYAQFTANTLPYIKSLGYNAIQLMAIAEHPYYGSFGYHVSNYFAPSSRFGSPEDLKHLIDTAHSMGIAVIMDIIHSHSVKNEAEGLAKFDGTQEQYFYPGAKGYHELWDSYLFNYGKDQVLHFLLSNIKYWKEEFCIDGFRFDGVTSMLYHSHGINKAFTSVDDYFDPNEVNDEAYTYLALANLLLHSLDPNAISIAEDVSGMPGTCAPVAEGGMGFDYRMAMGVSDMWFKLLDMPYENWNMFYIWHELTTKRQEEYTITYVESHDQSLVGGKTFIFTIADSSMYDHMNVVGGNLHLDTSLALHKLARFTTLYSAQNGYLNFIGNEWGHPEWLDFPREENSFSHKHARRLWSIALDKSLNYNMLMEFDREIIQFAHNSKTLTLNFANVLILNDDNVIVFQRGNYYFVINFSQHNSYDNYHLEVAHKTLVHVFDSDEKRFGGFQRLKHNNTPTYTGTQTNNNTYNIQLYLPTFTAIVLHGKN